ncbi:MAG: tetratricopeptide repeat protein [Planctomycetes bacterium]|nr:tetratricopeptide repeat protein [Planctomycetota bacterium]
MFTIILSAAIGAIVWLAGIALDIWGWVGGFFVGLLAFVIVAILVLRRVNKTMQPALLHVRRQTEARALGPAIQSLEALLPVGRWMPMLAGQLQAQIGTLAHFLGDDEKALSALRKSSKRSAEGQLMLGSLLYRRGDKDEALRVLAIAAAVHRKNALLHNTRAWLLAKEGRTQDAIAALVAYLKRDANNEPTKDNLLRLQNDRKMSMQRFGMEWFALQLEKPPQSMGEMRPVRKGFRTPPKNPGKRSKPK